MGRRDVRLLLKQLHENGVTVFYSSHVLGDVEAICTRLAMVVDGQIRREGTVDEVLAGEEESFHITLACEIKAEDIPKGICEALDARTVMCHKPSDKTQFLQWALARGLEVESLQRSRHSLEDVLAKEVAAGRSAP
jgi:ABC-2 type transport system ATP-binding protein